jgi:hypothetical protein
MSGVTSNLVCQSTAAVQSLFYGDSRTAIAQVIPNADHPSLWRVRWPDGQLSMMTNLTRAKDVAAAMAERGPPARDPARLRWRSDRSDARSARRGRVSAAAPSSTQGGRAR